MTLLRSVIYCEFHIRNIDQLQSFIKYKALEAGVRVEYVAAKNTSRMCSNCGHTRKSNRKDQAHFKCLECGYEVNADVKNSAALSAKLTVSSLPSAAEF